MVTVVKTIKSSLFFVLSNRALVLLKVAMHQLNDISQPSSYKRPIDRGLVNVILCKPKFYMVLIMRISLRERYLTLPAILLPGAILNGRVRATS